VTRSTRLSPRKLAAVGAVTLGLIGGSYGVAAAATNSSPTATPSASQPARGSAPPGATATNPWGNQRRDETLLTGDTLAKVKAAALAKVGSGSTIVRIETDADGHAAYESHMLKADGTAVTVYVDKSFNVVSVESH
jgi:pyruvate/2-oxoglutarate dehydrogenase complex dihydrolipoamide acyltransferase (E2) component